MGFRQSVCPACRIYQVHACGHRVSQTDTFSTALENQVTPFSLTTSDRETLYAWHILPLPLYSRYENELSAQPSGFYSNIEESLNFKLLSQDPSSRLVLYCEFRIFF